MRHPKALFFINSCHSCIQPFSGYSSFGSSLSALQVLGASLPQHHYCFHDHPVYFLVAVEPGNCFPQPCRESQNWVETVERGIPRKKPLQGLKCQLHSCSYYWLFQKVVRRKGFPAAHSYHPRCESTLKVMGG